MQSSGVKGVGGEWGDQVKGFSGGFAAGGAGLRGVIGMLFVVASLLLVTQIGNAEPWDREFETVSLRGGNFALSGDQSRILTIDSWRYVQKVIIRAAASSPRSAFTVWANGEKRLEIEPLQGGTSVQSYTVDLFESVSAIEIKNLRGANQLFDVAVVQSKDTVFSGNDGSGSSHPISVQSAQAITRETRTLVDQLRVHATFANYGTFLLPILKAANRAYAATAAPGLNLLPRTLGALQAQIAAADVYLNEAFEVPAAADLAVELLMLRHRLEDLLD